MRIAEPCHKETPRRRLRWRLANWLIGRAIHIAPDSFAAIDLEYTIRDWRARWTDTDRVTAASSLAGTRAAAGGIGANPAQEASPWAR